MEDVAAKAGVSRALVSIVYRDAPGASDTTRARVLEAAAELDYRPDHRARLLGRQRTKLLGVVYGVRHAFHGDLVEALYAAADLAGYDVALSAVAPTRDEPRAIQALLDYRCEGLILLGPDQRAKALAELAAAMPTVVVARKVTADGVDVVRSDDSDGLRQAVEHLVSLGHRRVVHVDGGRAPGAAERRVGYKTAMRRAGMSEHIWVVGGGLTEDDGVAAAKRILREAPRTTAVAAFNDKCAIGMLDTLRKAGRDVPGEMSVVGYDDSNLAGLSHVNLTTIGQDPKRLAELAVGRAVARLDGDVFADDELVVPPSLVVRGTTAAPKEA
jgi:DNA-binding LacI/PurR family transcriptional regulator